MNISNLLKMLRFSKTTYRELWINIIHHNFSYFSFLTNLRLRLYISGCICSIMYGRNTVRNRSLYYLWWQSWFVARFKNINLTATQKNQNKKWAIEGDITTCKVTNFTLYLTVVSSIISSKRNKNIFAAIGAHSQTQALW